MVSLSNFIRNWNDSCVVQINEIIFFRVITACFVFDSTFQFLYDLTIFINPNEEKTCNLIVDNLIINEILWFFSRSIYTYLWIIPIIYLFWPSVVKNEGHHKHGHNHHHHSNKDKCMTETTLKSHANYQIGARTTTTNTF